MRHDWNSLLSDQPSLLFRHFSEEYYPPADALVDYLGEYASQLGLRVRYNTTIMEVARDGASDGSGFVLADSAGTRYECEKVIMATGLKTNEPDTIVGAEHAVTYEQMSLDRAEYKDKKVLIVGKGNAAFETAWHLMPATSEIRMISRNPVRLAPITHYVGDLRVVNDEALGAYQLKSLVSLLETDAQIKNTTIRYTIVKDEPMFKGTKEEGKLAFYYERMGGPPGEEAELYRKRGPVAYDQIILCTGFVLDQSIFSESTQPQMDYRNKYPVLAPSYESINQPVRCHTPIPAHCPSIPSGRPAADLSACLRAAALLARVSTTPGRLATRATGASPQVASSMASGTPHARSTTGWSSRTRMQAGRPASSRRTQ
jgi:lysine/ornithine N-monooxygenase